MHPTGEPVFVHAAGIASDETTYVELLFGETPEEDIFIWTEQT